MKQHIIPAAVLAAALVTAAGCGATHAQSSSQERASVSALASVPGADATAILAQAGVPVHGTAAQQIAFGKAMMSEANRHALAAKLQIPPQNRSAFEAAVLGAAEKGHLGTQKGRVTFFDVTLPNLVKQYEA